MFENLFGHSSTPSTPASSSAPAQDSGENLVGVECYYWDDDGAGMCGQGVIRAYIPGSRYPYKVGADWMHARPVALGLPPGKILAGGGSSRRQSEGGSFDPDRGLTVGDRVRHPSNGLGTIVRVDGDGMPRVKFDDGTIIFQAASDLTKTGKRAPAPPSDDFADALRQMGMGRNPFLREERSEQAVSNPEPTAPTVTWDDVKGQDEAKQALREAIELPRTYSALYAAYGKRPSKGCLLYGPPGCGKTMLGRTLAQSLGGGEEGFRYVKGGEFQTNTVGDSERKIREAFSAARDYKRRTGIPQVIFFDEADALFPMRTGRKSESHSYDFMASNMAAILTELDGLQECAAFVILATNRPEVMDPALLRDGRIDRKVRVARPDREVCADILRAGLSKAPGFQEEMVKVAANEIYNPALCYYIAETEDRGAVRVNFHHQASGALLDGIVERTINEALQRDIAAGRTEPSGLTEEDIRKAVDASWRSTLGLDLQWLLEEVVGPQKIASIKTVNGRFLGIKSNKVPEIKVKHEIERPDDLLG